MEKSNIVADILMQVVSSRNQISQIPSVYAPADITEAYAIQDAFVEQLKKHYDSEISGYKIGCTNGAAQEFLGVEEPFSGRLFATRTYTSPQSFAASDFMMRIIEPEFAVKMAQNLPPRSEPYSYEQVAAAVEAIYPAIEIVESRYQEWTKVGALSLVSDQAEHNCIILGEPITNWQHLDLAAHEMTLWINGNHDQTGRGSVVLGHPFKVLTWLANHLNARDLGLRAGQVVTTGVCVDRVYPAQAGDTIKADFGELGTVEVNFS